MQWGDEFDVAAEFHGLLSRLREEQRKLQLQALHAKMHGLELNRLNEQERVLYRQLLQRG